MGPLSLEAGLARLRVAGSGHASLFKKVVDRLPLWERHTTQDQESWEKNSLKDCLHTYPNNHTLSLYSMLCYMQMVVVWLYKPRVPHHVIAVVFALLISAVPFGLYNWETADSCDLTFTPCSPHVCPKAGGKHHQHETPHIFDLPFRVCEFFNISWQTLHLSCDQ